MNNPYPCTGAWGQCSSTAEQQQYPQHQQQYPAQQTYPAVAQYPAAASLPQNPGSAAAGPATAWQQCMQAAPPAGQYAPYAAAQQGSSSTDFTAQYQHQQQEYQQYQEPEFNQTAQQQQGPLQEDSAAGAADGSRGLGTAVLGASHQMHKVGMVMHHVAHPVQGLKYHTVDKVKRKLKGKVCHLVDKVLP